MSSNQDMTDIIFVSKIEVPKLNFTFNLQDIPFTDYHKHIRVTLSNGAKKNELIDTCSIVLSASKYINKLQKLKT